MTRVWVDRKVASARMEVERARLGLVLAYLFRAVHFDLAERGTTGALVLVPPLTDAAAWEELALATEAASKLRAYGWPTGDLR